MQRNQEPMRIVAKISAVLAVILLVISTFFQGLAVYATVTGTSDILEKQPWMLPCWIVALVLLPVSAVLNRVFRDKENWALSATVVALVGAVLALIVALALKDALPVKVGTTNVNFEQGLDSWKLTYRHLSSVIAGGLVALAGVLNHVASRSDRINRENAQYENRFDLSGDPLFTDGDASSAPRKLKRSQRAAQRKADKTEKA